MTPLELAAEAYRKAQLEFEAADAAEALISDEYSAASDRIKALHPELDELGRRFGAAAQARREAHSALTKAAHALHDAASGKATP